MWINYSEMPSLIAKLMVSNLSTLTPFWVLSERRSLKSTNFLELKMKYRSSLSKPTRKGYKRGLAPF